MKKIFLASIILVASLTINAQVTKVSLQASGLTCSMCSKAVLTALQNVSFVEKVQVDIKNQQYNVTFKPSANPDLDALADAVKDAGFGVASFTVTANVDAVTLKKDDHVRIGNQYFHFLNAASQQLSGETSFTIVDRQYTTSKNFKKYSGMSRMECVQTGKAASCCARDEVKEQTRIYHAII